VPRIACCSESWARPRTGIPLHARFEAKRINHGFAFSGDGACTNQAESYFSRLRRTEFGQRHGIAQGQRDGDAQRG